MDSAFQLIANGIVAAVLIGSAVAKIQFWRLTVDWVERVAPRVRPQVPASLLVSSEFVVASMLALEPSAGAKLAAGWLILATLGLVYLWARDLDCGCFGQPKRVTGRAFVRNGALLSLCVVGTVASSEVSVTYGVVAISILSPSYLLAKSLATFSRPIL